MRGVPIQNTKERLTTAISRAHSDLEAALAELEKMPAFDPGSVAFSAHTINNYLNVTNGAVELVLMQLADYPDVQVKMWLEGVQHATNLIASIVNQMMNNTVSKESQFRMEKIDFPTLVKRCCHFYQRVANRKTIQVVPEITGDVPAVWSDRAATAAVLDNLLSNAVKFSYPGKTIRVQVHGEKGWVICEVCDEGPGLSHEDHSLLFKRGSRLTPRPTGGESSTGYGLAVARELVENLGGRIWCDSALGRGSCFAFCLPVFQEPGN